MCTDAAAAGTCRRENGPRVAGGWEAWEAFAVAAAAPQQSMLQRITISDRPTPACL